VPLRSDPRWEAWISSVPGLGRATTIARNG
jgi:hypothetical protein